MATKSNSSTIKTKLAPIFNDLNIYIISKGIGSIQLRVIQEQIQKRGGKLAVKHDQATDLIISTLDYFKTLEALGNNKPRARIHKLAWITESLSRGKRAGDNEFLLESYSTEISTKPGALQRTLSDLGATRNFLKRKLEDSSGPIFTPPAKKAKTTDYKFELNIKKGGLVLSYELDEADTKELPLEKIKKPIGSAAPRNKLPLLHSASQPILSFEKKDSSQSSSSYECEDHLKKSQELSPQGKKKPDINPFLALLRQSSQPVNTNGFEEFQHQLSQESSSAGSTPATSPTGKFNSPPNKSNSNINRSPFLRNSTSPESPPKRAMRMIKGNSFAKLLFDEERDSGEEYDTDEEEMILELKEEKKRIKIAKKGNSGTKLERTSSDLAKLSEMDEYVPSDSQAVFFDENSNDPTSPPFYSKFLYNVTPEEKEKRDRRRQYFVCQKTPQQLQAETNVNKLLTDQLQILEQNCQTKGDKWRSYAYRKAIAVLKATKFEIKTAEQAKKLRGIGSKIADKIGEILSTGTLRRIKSEAEDEMTKTLVMFSKVFGAGPETAKKWYAKGYRTIEDLKNSDKLTAQQKVGVKYFEEFQKRIPREEVDTLSGIVFKHALEIDNEFIMEVCGSYRRGKKDCGDIDVLLTHKTNRPIDGAMEKLIDVLTEIGFLTDHLTDPHKSKENDKYMGVCQWGDLPHRRIDIKIVPKEEWWLALLYFTGSDHFNRSMRLWARRHGYQLTEKHIVKRYAEEVLGEPIPVNSEQDVFAVLGLEYRPPNEREV